MQATQIEYDASGVGEARLLVTGLFVRGKSCLELNSRSAACGDGVLPYFLASVPVSPTNTAAVEQEVGLLCASFVRGNQARGGGWEGRSFFHTMG